MLALKTMSMDGQHGKTLIFDEVDAGIGGRVADVVGVRLGRLGERFQVLCITHLPQIASRATTHFHIDKAVRGTRTVTAVRRLDDDGRVEEIARMIGGAVVSDQTRASARELLGAAGGVSASREAKGKQKTKGESESLGARRRV
jgi:DNA repair protein RecN (Recombination protein N)